MQILFKSGMFKSVELDETNKICSRVYHLLITSFIDNNGIYRHSLDNLSGILGGLNKLRSNENDWIVDVIILIMMHQSLDNNTIRPNYPVLTENDIRNFFDSRLIELMLILNINDSLSHTMFNRNEFVEQINKSQIKFRQILNQSVKNK